MIEIALTAAGLVVVVSGMVILAGSRQVLRLCHPDALLRPDPMAIKYVIALMGEGNLSWQARFAPEPLGSFAFENLKLAIFAVEGTPTRLAAYVIGRATAFEFCTGFGPDSGLDTSTSMDANLFPCRPGWFKETLPLRDLGQLYEAHQRSLVLLREQRGLLPATLTQPLDGFLLRLTREAAQGVRTLFWWPLRLPYWYFFRRRWRHGMTIETQLRKGLA
jgi:hypothetical protein